MPTARRILPLVLLAGGIALLVAAGVCYQMTGGGLWCHLMLGAATLACVGAFVMAWQRPASAEPSQDDDS